MRSYTWSQGLAKHRFLTSQCRKNLVRGKVIGFVICCSVAKSCQTLCNPINYNTPGFPVLLSFTIFWSLLKLMSIELGMPCNHLILCCPSPPALYFPSIRVFSSESALCVRWLKFWSFSFSISPSNEYLGLISFRLDWFDLLAVQGLDSQKPSPTPQFKSVSSSALRFLYSLTLRSIHDYWKNHSFDCMHLCQQSDVFAF